MAWPLPFTLDVAPEVADQASAGGHLNLRDAEGVLLAVLAVAEQFEADPATELEALYGTTRADHPGVVWWARQHQPDRLAGSVEGVEPATHWSFADQRLTPAQSAVALGAEGDGRDVWGLVTREPLHRADVRRLLVDLARDGARRAAASSGDLAEPGSKLLVLGAIGPGPDQPFDPHLLVRSWTAVAGRLPDPPLLVVSPLRQLRHRRPRRAAPGPRAGQPRRHPGGGPARSSLTAHPTSCRRPSCASAWPRAPRCRGLHLPRGRTSPAAPLPGPGRRGA